MSADAARFLGLAHRLWRMLPAEARRRAYRVIPRLMVSRPAWTPRTPRWPCEPYLVAGPLSAPTGLGQASRLVLHALSQAGRNVSALDIGPALMQPFVVPIPALHAPSRGPGTLLLMSQPPTIAHSLALIGRDLLQDKLRVGLWTWEVDRLPADWQAERRLMHEVGGPSRFVQRIFAEAWGAPVRYLPWPVAARPVRPVRRERGGETVFGAALDLGSTVARKNPFAVLHAFGHAFKAGDPVRLRLKLRDARSAPRAFADLLAAAERSAAPVDIIAQDLEDEALEEWWQGLDVFISLHRSEGFGLLPAEAMQRGIPVIATDWSATAEFVSGANGWPVPVDLVPATDDTLRYALPGAVWAEPRIDRAREALREAAADPDLVREKGAQAALTIERLFSADTFVKRLEAERDAA